MSRKVPAGDKPMLGTERLVLRPLSTDEVDSLHHTSNEPNVRLYLWDNEAISKVTLNSLIAQSTRMFSKEKIGLFGVRMRGRKELLGFCGFVRLGGMEEPAHLQHHDGVLSASRGGKGCAHRGAGRPYRARRVTQGA